MKSEENQINGFTFFRNYYDIVDNLPEDQKKEMLVAIVDYVFNDKEPSFDGVLLAVFNAIRMGLDTSKNRAGNARNRGEKPSQNQKQIKTKSKQNQKEIKTKSNENQKSSSDLSYSYSNSYSNSLSILENKGVGEETFSNAQIEKVVVDNWNKIGLSHVQSLSKSRKDKIRLRVKEQGLERVLEAFRRVEQSSFLMGDNKQGWKCTFDWLFANDSNIVKVLEGNYDDRKTIENVTSNPFLKSIIKDKLKEYQK